MAIKLYQYDAESYKSATDFKYPNKMQSGLFIHWWQEGYVSMDTAMAALLNPLNDNAFSKSDADGVAAVKALSKSYYDNLCVSTVGDTYSIHDELRAHRTSDSTVLNNIQTIINSVKAERDTLLDVS